MLTEFKDSDSAIRARLRKLGFKATAFLPDWRETLRACDFHLAKRELQSFFHCAVEQTVARQGEGGRCIYRVDFVRGWEVFAERPCYDTAVAFIERCAGLCRPHLGILLGILNRVLPGRQAIKRRIQ